MFNLFKQKNKIENIEWLGVDIHSHLVPGIDDGAKDLEQSLRYITRLKELGFHKLICTPHIFKELYPNSCDTINPALETLRQGLTAAGIDMEISAAAEYMIDEQFEITDTLLCLPEKYVLIEMSYLNESPNIEDVLFKLQLQGYKPVLAHPERYIYYFSNNDRLLRFKNMGCLLQLNILSVLGYYGKEVKAKAETLLRKELYDLAGTDIHHDKHLSVIENGVKSGKLYKLIGKYPFKNQQLFGGYP